MAEKKTRKKEEPKPELGLTKKGTPRKRKYPEGRKGHKTSGSYGELINMEPGDNTRFTRNVLTIAGLPPIDRNDPTAVQQRINEYFQIVLGNDLKPSVAGVALALGMSRSKFIAWAVGDRRAGQPQGEMAKQVYSILNTLWEDYMLNGKVNPAAGIFIGKNNFGYRDEQKLTFSNDSNNIRDGRTDAELKAIYDLPIETNAELVD